MSFDQKCVKYNLTRRFVCKRNNLAYPGRNGFNRQIRVTLLNRDNKSFIGTGTQRSCPSQINRQDSYRTQRNRIRVLRQRWYINRLCPFIWYLFFAKKSWVRKQSNRRLVSREYKTRIRSRKRMNFTSSPALSKCQ